MFVSIYKHDADWIDEQYTLHICLESQNCFVPTQTQLKDFCIPRSVSYKY